MLWFRYVVSWFEGWLWTLIQLQFENSICFSSSRVFAGYLRWKNLCFSTTNAHIIDIPTYELSFLSPVDPYFIFVWIFYLSCVYPSENKPFIQSPWNSFRDMCTSSINSNEKYSKKSYLFSRLDGPYSYILCFYFLLTSASMALVLYWYLLVTS